MKTVWFKTSRHVNLVPATQHTQALIATIDAAIAAERTSR